MGKSAGKAPDFTGAAEQTAQSGQANVQTQLQANRPTISTPFGGQSWVQGPNGQWTMNSTLAPGMQNTAEALQTQLRGLNQPLDPSLGGPVMGGDAAREQAITSAFNASTSRLNPLFQQRREALSAQLANQGLDPNSAAFRNSMGQLGTEQTDATQQALAGAIGQGTQAGQAIFQQNLQGHQQALADALRLRSQPLSELQSLQGFTATPGFNTAGMAQPTDYLGALQSKGQWQTANPEPTVDWGSILGTLGTIAAGTAMAFSDERLKDNVERHEVDLSPGVPLATWEWKGDQTGTPQVGAIAQDVEKVAPELVATHPSGFKQVDYARLLRRSPK